MLSNRTSVTIHLNAPIHGQKHINGTIYEHTPEWVNLDWDCVARGKNGKEFLFRGYIGEHRDYDYQSLWIPTSNIAGITELR